MTPLQRLYRMGKTELRLCVTVYQDHFSRGVEILLFSTRYYPSPYPVTNRIMTVQPTMSPYMSPVSAYQVDPQDLEIDLPNSNFPLCFLSHLMCICYVYWYVGCVIFLLVCVGGECRYCRCERRCNTSQSEDNHYSTFYCCSFKVSQLDNCKPLTGL